MREASRYQIVMVTNIKSDDNVDTLLFFSKIVKRMEINTKDPF